MCARFTPAIFPPPGRFWRHGIGSIASAAGCCRRATSTSRRLPRRSRRRSRYRTRPERWPCRARTSPAFCWAPPKPARCGVRMSGSMRPDRQSPSRSWCATCTGWPLPGGFRNHAAPSTCWCQRATRTCCARGTGWGLASNRRTPYARCRTRRGPRRPGLWCAGHGAATCPRSPGSRSSCHDSTASPPPSRPSRCRAMRSAWPDGRRTSTTGPTPPSWPSSTAPSSAQASAVRSSCRAATHPSPGPTTQASSPLPLSSACAGPGRWPSARRSRHRVGRAGGYGCVATDWRVTNLLSSRTWPRLGFAESFLRLHRLVGY